MIQQSCPLGVYPKVMKNYVHTNTCTWMFKATSFILAHTWKWPKCPSPDECIISCVHYSNGNIFTVLKISNQTVIWHKETWMHVTKSKMPVCMTASTWQWRTKEAVKRPVVKGAMGKGGINKHGKETFRTVKALHTIIWIRHQILPCRMNITKNVPQCTIWIWVMMMC